VPGPRAVAVHPEDPRQRVAQTSIRLVEPPAGATTDVTVDSGQAHASGRSSPIPFRGRLGDGPEDAPVRHLRPVPDGSGQAPEGPPGGGRATDGVPLEEPEGTLPPDDEENPHGPNPGGNG